MKSLRLWLGTALLLAAGLAGWLVSGPAGQRARPAAEPPAPSPWARLQPEPGARLGEAGPTRIAAHLGGVVPAGFVLRVDGLDVTEDARWDGGELQYHEYLPPGAHRVELVVRESSGQVRRADWSFAIQRSHWNWPLSEWLDEDLDDEGWPFWGLPRP